MIRTVIPCCLPAPDIFDEYELICSKRPEARLDPESVRTIYRVLDLSGIDYALQLPSLGERRDKRARLRLHYKIEDEAIITGALLFCKALCKDITIAV